MTLTNDGTEEITLATGAFILYHGASVSTSGFDYFTYSYNDPSYAHTFNFLYHDSVGSSSVTKNYNADFYTAAITVGAGETKTVHLSFSGPAGIWAEQSSNTSYPWVDEYGYWEFVGDGFWTDPFKTFTVNLTLPSTLDTYKLLGWDVSPMVSGNQFTFEMFNVQEVDMDLVFKTSKPLAPVPEPATMLLLASGLVGLVGGEEEVQEVVAGFHLNLRG